MLLYKVSICDSYNDCRILNAHFETEKEFLSWLNMIKSFHPNKNITYEKVESRSEEHHV